MQTIYFFYGLAFLVMSLTIFVMPKKNDILSFSEDLWLVGMFGLVHGSIEWAELLILRGEPFNVAALTVIAAVALPVSFVFLVSFGIRILFRGSPLMKYLQYLWALLLLGWAATYYLTRDFLIPGIIARYFICLPGAWMTAAGLCKALQRAETKWLPRTVFGGVMISAGAFFAYGIFSGIVVPPADFFPASFVNVATFARFFDIPVHFFRMVCTIFLALGFFLMAGVYFYSKENTRVAVRGGIKGRVTLLFCAVSFAATMLTGAGVYYTARKAMLQGIEEGQAKVTRILADAVSEVIGKEIKDLKAHVSSGEWRAASEAANKRYAIMSPEAIADYMAEVDRQWVAAPKNSSLLRSYLDTAISRELKNQSDADGDVAEVFFTDREGGLVAASEKTTDFFQADEPWWQKAYKEGKGDVFVGDMEVDVSSGVLSFPVAVPLLDENGVVVGICKESVSGEILFRMLKAFKEGRTGHAALIGANGALLSHRNSEAPRQKKISKEEIQLISRQGVGFIDGPLSIHSGRRLASFRKLESPLLLENGIVWYLIVSQDAEEAFAPLRRLTSHMALYALAILGVTLFFGFFVGGKFSKPIRELDVAVKKIVAGSWEKIDIRTGDEIQEFAESFNYMIDNLHRRQDELVKAKREIEGLSRGLETKVEERTRDLTEAQRISMEVLKDLKETNEELKRYAGALKRSKEETEIQAAGLAKANAGIQELNQKLEAKNKELEKLDEIKSHFVSVVAHELRTPLCNISTAASVIMEGLAGPVADKQRTYLDMIGRAVEGLIHITNDLLDLAKIEAGKMDLFLKTFDLLSLIRGAKEGIELRAQKKGIGILERFSKEKVEMSGDPGKIQQVLTNLLSNAVKFTEKGNITIEVEDEDREVRCVVADTGPGIEPRDLARLFNKFEQFGKVEKSSEKGTGLGLAISKNIVEAHGGRLWAESEVGKGSRFIFILPKQPKIAEGVVASLP